MKALADISSFPNNSISNLPNGRVGRRSKAAMEPKSYGAINGHAAQSSDKTSPKREHDVGAHKLPRLRLKVKLPSVGIQHPAHILPPKKYGSFREWVQNEAASTDVPSHEAALQEARLRERVREASEPGGALSQERCSFYMSEPEEEPPKQYSHQDHFVAHAVHFCHLLREERKKHLQQAKLLAHACASVWRRRNRDPEDIIKEQEQEIRRKHRQLVKDLQRQFDLVRTEIEKRRLARWEEEKKLKDQQALNKAIRKSTMLFQRRRSDRVGDLAGEGDASAESDSELEEGTTESGSENESDMSEDSDTEDDDDAQNEDRGDGDRDAGLTEAELRLKYADIQSLDESRQDLDDESLPLSPGSSPQPKHFTRSDGPTSDSERQDYDLELDDVDSVLMDDSDESIEMSDDMEETEHDIGSSEEEEDSSEGARKT
jgi:helicase SWR1